MFENYDLDDIETEIVDAFISAFVDRDPIAMRELIYQLTGGKGSHARKTTAESRQAYRDNYDRIFGKK